jgi:DNA ligase 4
VTLQDLHKIARQSVGRDRSTKDVDDWTKEVWGNVPSPGVRCEKKRKEREVGWVEKLGLADGVGRTRKKKLKALDSSSPLRDKDMRLGTGATNVVDRPVLGVKPLGSLFNIADSLPMPPPSNAMRARRAGPGGMKDRQKNTFVVSVMPSISTLTPAIGSQMATPPLSADSISKVYASKPIVTFVKDAFVWFAQPCNTPRPTWRPPIKDLLGLSCRLHSLESLLTGCGWQSQGVAMKHGVVFVDQSTSYGGRSWKEYTLKTLQERHALLTPATRRNPIWVFDVVLLGFDALETTEGDVRQLALCRFD